MRSLASRRTCSMAQASPPAFSFSARTAELTNTFSSGDEHYEKSKNQNILREQDVAKIVDTYKTYLTDPSYGGEEKYSYVATLDEIKENDYNLNIPRYVDTFEEEALVDIDEVKTNIKNIEDELSKVQKQMAKYMKELGL